MRRDAKAANTNTSQNLLLALILVGQTALKVDEKFPTRKQSC